MLFINPGDGNCYDTIERAVCAYCSGKRCPSCLFESKSTMGCLSWAAKNPIEAATLMGFVAIPEPGVDVPLTVKEPRAVAFVTRFSVERVEAPETEAPDERIMPMPPSTDDRIKALLNRAGIASQLAEEGNELAQAAWKLHRLEGGENPVRMSEAEILDNLVEEIADVSLCLRLLGLDTGLVRMKVAKIMEEKVERWAADLEKNQ